MSSPSFLHSYALWNILLLLLVFVNLLVTIADSGALVVEVCKEIDDTNFCIQALQSDPRTIKATNLKDLAPISVDLAYTNATSSVSKIESLIKQTTDPNLKEILNSCLENFEDAVENLESAKEDVKVDNYSNANMRAHYSYSNALECEDLFKNEPTYRSPLSIENRNLMLLSEVIGAITMKLK